MRLREVTLSEFIVGTAIKDKAGYMAISRSYRRPKGESITKALHTDGRTDRNSLIWTRFVATKNLSSGCVKILLK